MNGIRMLGAGLVLLGVAGTAFAGAPADLGKGSTAINLLMTESDASLAAFSANGAGGLSPSIFSTNEVGLGGEIIHFPAERVAVNGMFGVGLEQATLTGTNAAGNTAEAKEKISSWKARVGFDYVAHLSENRLHIFAGPGFQYWTGKPKIKGPGETEYTEGESTKRYALHGRMAAHLALTRSVGLFGSMGHWIGHANSDDSGAKASWWDSGHDGSMGLSFNFGGGGGG